MTTQTPLYPGVYYHLYNRGNNHQNLFFQDRDYRLFLERCARFTDDVAEIFAYCLLPNHFHLLVRIRDEEALMPVLERKENPFKVRIRSLPDFISDEFSNWFNSYTRTINNRYSRDGNLFKRPFQRKEIHDETYLIQVVWYIHFNAQKHGLSTDFRTWKYSSYAAMLSGKPTRLQRAAVLEWFGGAEAFRFFHEDGLDERILGDWGLEG